jgi:pimeloyl-[acyl-carrier protein] methyl ester esterase
MRTPLLLLPGMDGTGRLFAPLAAHLPPTIDPRTIAYPVDAPLSYDALEHHLRPRLPPHGPWYLLGESFSGPLALRLAASRPPGLCGVILAATFVTPPLALPRWLHRLAVPALFSALALRLAARVLGVQRLAPGHRAEFHAANAAVAPAVLACRARATLNVDLRAHADALAGLPILVLAARHDRVVGRRRTAEILALLPHADLRWFDAPHLLLQSRPAEAAAAIAEFTHHPP